MTVLLVFLSLLDLTGSVAAAAAPPGLPDVNLSDPAALREANRVLAEEIKLAAKPHMYVLIDLAANMVVIKSRAIELDRLPITEWSADIRERMTGVFRLTARPSVIRRKIDPTADTAQDPISLTDMPIHYVLSFQPPLTIEIVPSAGRSSIQWLFRQTIIWRQWVKQWWEALSSGPSFQNRPHLEVRLSENHAQSFAWSLVDGTPFVIRRATEN